AYYCPASTETLSAINVGSNGTGNRISTTFYVGNSGNFAGITAASDSAAPGLSGTGSSFDWGLPFFYGRNVYTSIWGVSPPGGVPAGPWWAY
ncbi:MAG: DUF3443 family protein, partial [Candidatus Korobacteraceae bacterium]